MRAPDHILHVELNARRYPIWIGASILGPCLEQLIIEAHPQHGGQILLLSNPTVAKHLLDPVLTTLSQSSRNYQVTHHLMPDGESYKNLSTFGEIMNVLVEGRFSRDCLIIALGGGVVGDMAGFVAATWQRGVRFIQIPTTLLAQVDSSVGGKTAVNHPGGKNLIGAFHQPSAVLIDTDTLNTLPEREFAAGLAEIIKYGIMADADFFVWLEKNMAALRRKDPAALSAAIQRSCAIKAEVVAADETEQGQRALLNLGHTFGHAIETATGYSSWLHGEAVAVGMIMAAHVSLARGYITATEQQAIQDLIQRAGLPIYPPATMTAAQWLSLMARDKKVLRGQMRFILPTKLGAAAIFSDITEDELTEVITRAGQPN